MAFLNNLAKGFIRSAVNQVGKDGGKIISNNIYGNNHSTPINLVRNSETKSTENLFEEKEYIFIKLFWAAVLSTILPIIGGLIVIYRGFVNQKKTSKKMFKIEKQAVYKIDRRYTTGKRFEGYREIKVIVEVDIDESKKRKNLIKSIGYFIIGGLSLLIYIINIIK
jgi:hypothetical protein